MQFSYQWQIDSQHLGPLQLGAGRKHPSSPVCAALCLRNAVCKSYRFIPAEERCVFVPGSTAFEMRHETVNAGKTFRSVMVRRSALTGMCE